MHFVCVYSKQLTDPLAETVQVDHYDQQMLFLRLHLLALLL